MIGIRMLNKNPEIKEIRVGNKKLDAVNRRVFEKIKENNQIMLEKQAMFLYNEYKSLPPLLTGRLQSSIKVYTGVRIARVSWHAVNPRTGFVYSDYVAFGLPGRGSRGGWHGYMNIILAEGKWRQAGLILRNQFQR